MPPLNPCYTLISVARILVLFDDLKKPSNKVTKKCA